MSTKLLMCPPDYFQSPFEINPWMIIRRNINMSLARTQWDLLYKLLTDQMGVEVELIKPVKGLPNMVFAGHAGLVFNKIFVRSNFRHKERQPEEAFFEAWFTEQAYEVKTLPKVHSFEGEADSLIMGDVLVCGYHLAQDIQAHEYLSKLTGKRCLSLGISDERLHRLDLCFCRLGPDSALYFSHAFNLNSQQLLKEFLLNSVLVRQDEALNLACNSIVIGKKIITANKAPQTHALLKLLGYQVYQLELSEFVKAGGSAKALALRL